MPKVRIEPLTSDMLPEAAGMLARAFLTNPLHVAAFGADQQARNEAFFRVGLATMKGPKYVALDGTQIVGLIHWVRAPSCQFSTLEKLNLVPAMMRGFGLRSALHVGAWLSVWSAHDPKEAHLHLGPIGVSPDAQGRHIGHQLMNHYCEELERGAHVGYLETDRRENVAFYRRFGFEVNAETLVLGVPNFFMTRRASPRP